MITFNRLGLIDFGPYREAELPLANQGLVLIKADNRDSTAADSNGSGKSHLFKALAWCLFGDTLEGDKTDEVVRKGAKVAQVEVEFTDGAHVYTVVRTRNKSTGNVALLQDDVDISGIVAKDTQTKILSLIGLDFVTFTNTVLYGQGDVNHFADPKTKDPERKAIMKKILRMEVLDGALAAIKTKLAVAQSQRNALQSSIPVLEAKRDACDSDSHAERIKELVARRGVLAKSVARKARFQAMAEEIKELLVGYDSRKRDINTHKESVRRIESKAAFERVHAAGIRQSIEKCQKQIALFKGGKCPTCSTPASGEHIQAELARVRAEMDADEVEFAEKGKAEAGFRKEAETLKESIRESEKELADEGEWRKRQSDVTSTLGGIARDEAALKTLDADVIKAKTAVAKAKEQRESFEAEIEEVRTETTTLDEEIRHLEFWQRGFGNQGMPSFVMDSIVPSLNDRTNQFLRVLSDGDITVDFDTVSLLKSGESRDKFSITPTVEGMVGTRPSTGQQKKINIAADVALMTILADRERSGIDMLLLDEVLDGLDKSGKSRVIDLLLELRRTRSSIFVVSHDEGLEAIFEKTITVVKEGGIARLER